MIRKTDGKLSIFGWGINDVDYEVYRLEHIEGKKKIVWVCPYYVDWKDMIRRCFDEKYHKVQPTYKNATICQEWQKLSNFIEWVKSQPNRDWKSCNLDKDFLLDGNKHYSPDNCVYITQNLNNFITNNRRDRGQMMLGVSPSPNSKKNPYRANCRDPLNNKLEYLGQHPTELTAHLIWKAKKHEHACSLADLQTDERVVKRLREMYSPETDWTNK